MHTETPSSFKSTNKQTNKQIKARRPEILQEPRGIISTCHLFQSTWPARRCSGDFSSQPSCSASVPPCTTANQFAACEGPKVWHSLHSLQLLSLQMLPFVLVKLYEQGTDEHTWCRLHRTLGTTCAASLTSPALAGCVWYLRNHWTFTHFERVIFLQPIQTKIKIKKYLLWPYWFCQSWIVHERCTGYNLASRAMWTSKSSIYKRPMDLSEPVYTCSWSPKKKNCFELIWASQTQTTLWRRSGSGNALLPTAPNI